MVTHTVIVDEPARGAGFGYDGWDPETGSVFTIDFTANSLQAAVNGYGECDFLAADSGDGRSFDGGNFAFYNFAQPDVRYSVAVAEPGHWRRPVWA